MRRIGAEVLHGVGCGGRQLTWRPAKKKEARRTVCPSRFSGVRGVHLILANLPGVSYESAPRRFRETRSTILNWQDSVIERSPRTVPYSTAAANRIFDGVTSPSHKCDGFSGHA